MERAKILAGDATHPGPAEGPHALAFLDPPYGAGLAAPALTALADGGWLLDGALCVVELAARDTFVAPAGFAPIDQRRHGTTQILFLRWSG